MSGEDQQICKCDDCGYEAPHDDLPEAADLSQRLDLNGPFTDVECPKCGALCYLIPSKKEPNYKLLQMRSSFCQHCNKQITGLLDVTGEGPGFGICWDCRTVGHFGVGPVEKLKDPG